MDENQRLTDDQSFPPPGWVNRDGACRMFGVSRHVWKQWLKRGRARCGKWFLNPLGRWLKLYPVEELEQLQAEIDAEIKVVEDPQRPGCFILPPGYVDRDEAARILGIGPDTLALWYTNGKVRCGKSVKGPNGKLRKIYPLAELQREMQEMEEARPTVPEGYVDIDGACQIFGITKGAWNIWKREGKAPRGKRWRSRDNTPCRIYAVEELRRLKEFIHGADKVYMVPGGSGQYHIPQGWMRLQDACTMFGVHENTWRRWEREGLITCGKQFMRRGLKLYPIEPLNRLLAECGKYAPPYPDPDRPGVYRIPLAGPDMNRREAIIDAEDLPQVEGKRWHCGDRNPGELGDVCTSNPDRSFTRLHQLIMGVSGKKLCVGHHNGDPLDCRRANLVVRTRSEKSAHNRKARMFCGRPCTSRFKGVCWSESKGKWKAYAKKDGVMRNLGYFDDEIAAAEVYDEAARELFGEHARLNFPTGVDAWLERENPVASRRAA